VVAIGGSAGKTTTRSTVSSVLAATYPGRVHFTRGNLNNRVGLPLTLLGVTEAHELCVLEVGTNQTGEVPELASVCEPDVAILTLVDLEHSEGLGDLDAIEAEEGALLRAVGPAGTVIGNGDDARVRRQVELSSARRKVLYGSSSNASYRIVRRELLGPAGARIVVERGAGETIELTCPLLGEPGALAVTAALAVAETLGDEPLDGATMERALVGVGEAGRLRLVSLANGAWVLDDSYNSNPASVQKSIETARELAASRGGAFFLVLGEMRELGPASALEHEKMGLLAGGSGARALFAVGGDASIAARAAEGQGMKVSFFEDAAEVAAPLAPLLGATDVVVVKASRGVRAERVVEGLVALSGSVE
jgi:UDP-N-acetylmuramoyl-tripeptide--D-alanyl-D-alanine ligase